jgi:Pyruvate/2-oxoacid:ferredoxin oxidoreductase delta subunit
MKNKSLKQVGLGLFIISVGLFVSLSFVFNINFNNSDLNKLTEVKDEVFAKNLSELHPAPVISMSGKLSKTIDEYNQVIVNEKGIDIKTVDEYLESLNNDASNFKTEQINEENGFSGVSAERLREYTGWMEGRNWADFSSFEMEFRRKAKDVNESIISEYGIGESSRSQVKLNAMLIGAPDFLKTGWAAFLIFGLAVLGGLIYFVPLMSKKPGIHNNHIYHNKGQTAKGPAIIVFIILVAFYIVLYQFPVYLTNQIALVEPLSQIMAGNASSQWFLYGFLYSLSMLVMGVRMMIKYRGIKYQQVRTLSVVFFQLAFAFTLPQILTRLQLPSYDLKSAWPLEYSFFFDYRVDQYMEAGTLGLYMFFWGIILFAVGVPLLTYFYGKRWYCSWVCGCGGLAETVGDPYRHLSDKSLGAWKIERWLVHGVLVFAVFMTAWVAYTTFSGKAELLGINSYNVRSTYGFFIGFVFAGAVGTGFYPVMGNRVWCRFGCPLAAYLGLVQRFKSRFRITTNGGQCISCGNCSTYCEMGIDVRWYAQRGQNIIRSSCVGCGVCSAVCPRGVLKLENKTEKGRINDNPILIGRDRATLNL